MFVSTTTRSTTILMLILLLVMSTLQPFLLSITVHASMVPGIMRKIMHSNLSIITPNRSTLSLGLLSQSSASLPPPVQQCIDSAHPKPKIQPLILQCFDSNEDFFKILEERGVHKTDAEYQCKSKFCRAYCWNLAARAYCTRDQHAAYFKVLQQELDSAAKGDCKPWTSYLPPMDPTPLDVSIIDQCEATLSNKPGTPFDDCVRKMIAKLGKDQNFEYPFKNIQDQTEYECKIFTGLLNCMSELACKHCKSANKFVDIYGANYWSLAKVECGTKWSGPKKNCAAFHIPLIVGIVLLVVVTMLVVIGVAFYFRCYSSGKSSGSSSKDDDDESRSVSKPKAPNSAESFVDAKQSNQA